MKISLLSKDFHFTLNTFKHSLWQILLFFSEIYYFIHTLNPFNANQDMYITSSNNPDD